MPSRCAVHSTNEGHFNELVLFLVIRNGIWGVRQNAGKNGDGKEKTAFDDTHRQVNTPAHAYIHAYIKSCRNACVHIHPNACTNTDAYTQT